jgi:hypothetical protein
MAVETRLARAILRGSATGGLSASAERHFASLAYSWPSVATVVQPRMVMALVFSWLLRRQRPRRPQGRGEL